MRSILPVLFVLAAVQHTTAQSNTSSVFRFLNISPTAQVAGLGGGHVGLYSGDFSLMHLNPAYLNPASSGSISASYVNLLSDANMGFSSGSLDFGNLGIFGVGIRYVGYGDFDRLDENGNDLGAFSANDLSLTLAYGISVTENLRAGAGVDFIHASYASYKSTAAAASGGLFYQDSTRHFSAGISVRNLGAQLTAFDDQREPLPLDVSIGITKKPEAFPFSLSLTLKKLNDWDLRVFGETEKPAVLNNLFRHVIFGGEALIADNLHIRLGYDHYLHEQTKTGRTIDLAGVAFGIGFEVKEVKIDLSRSSYSKLGGITRLSVKTDLIQ